MNRNEFLEILRTQLVGQMQEGKIAAHVRYYQDYIQQQTNAGHSEAEVLAELGDPRLIAKTLLDTDAQAQDVYEEDSGYSSSYDSSYGGYRNPEDRGEVKRSGFRLDLSTWYGKAIVIAGAALLIFLLVTILTAVAPFFIIMAIILCVLSWLKKR